MRIFVFFFQVHSSEIWRFGGKHRTCHEKALQVFQDSLHKKNHCSYKRVKKWFSSKQQIILWFGKKFNFWLQPLEGGDGQTKNSVDRKRMQRFYAVDELHCFLVLLAILQKNQSLTKFPWNCSTILACFLTRSWMKKAYLYFKPNN